MDARASLPDECSKDMPASLTESAELVNAGEELLSRTKIVSQWIDERCRQVLEADTPPAADDNGLTPP